MSQLPASLLVYWFMFYSNKIMFAISVKVSISAPNGAHSAALRALPRGEGRVTLL